MKDPPVRVSVVGAGLAGLRCAGLLHERGIEVTVFEAGDGPGGRARTDRVGDFSLDRGFQVLLTSYPEAREAFDYEALDLGSFEPGALIRKDGAFHPLTDPLRRPSAALEALGSPVGTLRDRLRLARMRFELAGRDPDRIAAEPQVEASHYLADLGFSRDMVESFFRPFFGGVLIDRELSTTSALLKLYFGYFATGDAALPAGGIGRLADQLAARLPADAVRTGSTVSSATGTEVVLESGERLLTDAVVVATDERSAARLLGAPDPGPGSVTTCLYFDAPAGEPIGRTLHLCGDEGGPVNEVAVPSAVAEGYAPEGRSLVSVSAVGEDALRPDLEGAAIDQLGRWFGRDSVSAWRPIASRTVEDALPPFPPGRFAPGTSPTRSAPDGPFVCGDYLESPSIQGALVSGRRAASEVARELGIDP